MKDFALFKRGAGGRRLHEGDPGWKEAYWYFEFTCRRKKYLRCLETADAKEAQKRAKIRAQEILSAIASQNWERVDATKLRRPVVANLGELFRVYRLSAVEISPRTVANNISSLKSVVRLVKGLDVKTEKPFRIYGPLSILQEAEIESAENARREESKSADERIEAFSCDILNRSLASEYQRLMITGAGGNLRNQDTAKITANSTLRQARSIFSRRLLAGGVYTELRLPPLDGFLGVPPLRVPKRCYSKPADSLVTATWEASKRLKAEDPDAYVAFLLSATCGLRKAEIAHARWAWLTSCEMLDKETKQPVTRHFVRVQGTDDFRPKGRDDRDIPVEPAVAAELEELRRTVGPQAYILPGTKTSRTELVFERLSAWMIALGWSTRLKAHEMRKYYGSIVAEKAGLFAAQKLLGHKDPSITSDYYAALINAPDVRIFR